jgi:hypothetical protein
MYLLVYIRFTLFNNIMVGTQYLPNSRTLTFKATMQQTILAMLMHQRNVCVKSLWFCYLQFTTPLNTVPCSAV